MGSKSVKRESPEKLWRRLYEGDYKIKLANKADLDALMDEKAYAEFVKSLG